MLFLLLTTVFEATAWPTFQEAVLNNSSVDYKKVNSPFDGNHIPTPVRVYAPFVVLTNVIEAQQMVSYIVNVEYAWLDERLKFDRNLLGVNFTLVPANTVWVPTVDCFNCIDVRRFDKETETNEVGILYDGRMWIDLKARLDTICSMDIEAFPFDTQYCGLDFHSGFSSNDGRVNLTATTMLPPFILLGTPEWDIYADFDSHLSNATTTKGDPHSIVSLRFCLVRNSTFYVVMLILPTMIVASICLAALTLPLDFSKGDKYMMGISGLLGLTFLLGIIIQQVPRSNKMPIMANWLLTEMAFCVFALAIDEPVRLLKRRFRFKERSYDELIDIFVFMIVVGGNAIVTVLLFVLRPSPSSLNPIL